MEKEIEVTTDMFKSLLTFASSVNESYQKEYSKIIYYLIKFTDVSEFIDDLVVQCLIILERRMSHESVKYVLLQIEEIAKKYPDMINCFIEFPVLDIVLQSDIVNTNMDSIAIMNTIKTFAGIGNETINELIKAEIRIDQVHEAMRGENDPVVYAAIDLATTVINASLVSTEWIRESGFIDTVLELTSSGQIPTKIKAIVLLITDTMKMLLTNEEKMKLVENAIDNLPEMHENAYKFITALYDFAFRKEDRDAFVEFYESLDIKEAIESCEKNESNEEAIKILYSILPEEDGD